MNLTTLSNDILCEIYKYNNPTTLFRMCCVSKCMLSYFTNDGVEVIRFLMKGICRLDLDKFSFITLRSLCKHFKPNSISVGNNCILRISTDKNTYGKVYVKTEEGETLLPISNAKEVCCGDDFSLILDNKGDVYKLSKTDGVDMYSSWKLPISAVVQISKYKDVTLMLDNFGSVWGMGNSEKWGEPQFFSKEYNLPTLIGKLNHIKQVSAGSEHCLALDVNGKVYYMGKEKIIPRAKPFHLIQDHYLSIVNDLPEIVQVCSGDFNSAFLDKDGNIYVLDRLLEFYDSDTQNLTPIKVGCISNVAYINILRENLCGILKDGRVFRIECLNYLSCNEPLIIWDKSIGIEIIPQQKDVCGVILKDINGHILR